MAERETHFLYSPEFVEEINERNGWSKEQWQEAVRGWNEDRKGDFALINDLSPQWRIVFGLTMYDHAQTLASVNSSINATAKEKRKLEQMKVRTSFIALHANLSPEAHELALNVLSEIE